MILAAMMMSAGKTILVTIGGTGPWGFLSGSFGSISPTSYTDHGGTSRTISVIDYNASGTSFFFRITAPSVTNDDSVFSAIVVGGKSLLRSDATYDTGSDTYSQWSWNVGSNILGTSGTVPVQIL